MELPPVHIFQVDYKCFVPLVSSSAGGSNATDDQEPPPILMPSIGDFFYFAGFLVFFLMAFGLVFWTDWLFTVKSSPLLLVVIPGLLTTLFGGYIWIENISLQPDQEPFVFWGSVSTWPSTIIRMFAVILAGIFILKSYSLFQQQSKISELWDLMTRLGDLGVTSPAQVPLRKFFKRLRLIRRFIRTSRLPRKMGSPRLKKLMYWFSRISVRQQRTAEAASSEILKRVESTEHSNQWYSLPNFPWRDGFDRLLEIKTSRRRFGRTALSCAAFIIFALVAFHYDHIPWNPTRGQLSQYIYITVLGLSVFFPLFLVLFVIDAMAVSQSMVLWLTNRVVESRAKVKALEFFPKPTSPIPVTCTQQKKIINCTVEIIRFIAERTRLVEQIIYYPFICLLLLLFARDANFSRYDWPISLTIIIPVPYLILGLIVFALQADAKKARSRVLELIADEQESCDLLRDEPPLMDPAQSLAAQILRRDYSSFLVRKKEEIDSLDSGAYASLYNTPLFQSVLIPLGGVGGLQIIAFIRQYVGS